MRNVKAIEDSLEKPYSTFWLPETMMRLKAPGEIPYTNQKDLRKLTAQ